MKLSPYNRQDSPKQSISMAVDNCGIRHMKAVMAIFDATGQVLGFLLLNITAGL